MIQQESRLKVADRCLKIRDGDLWKSWRKRNNYLKEVYLHDTARKQT